VNAEPGFVNVYGAPESIPPDWESIPGPLKRFTNTGSDSSNTVDIFRRIEKEGSETICNRLFEEVKI
jgi:hypothetical protein